MQDRGIYLDKKLNRTNIKCSEHKYNKIEYNTIEHTTQQ